MSDPATDYAFGPMVEQPPCPNCGWPGIMCLKLADCPKPVPLPWLEFELPSCPSKNKKKQKLGNSTPEVEEWAHQADMAYMALPPEVRQKLRATRFCEFEAQFLHGRNNRADFHNYEEFLFDWLQDRGFIKNDKHCQWRSSGWANVVGVNVPKGRVVVRLRPWMRS